MSGGLPGFTGSRVKGTGGQLALPVQVVVHAEKAPIPQALQRSKAPAALPRCAALQGKAVALVRAE